MRYEMSEIAKVAFIFACINLLIVGSCSLFPESKESFDINVTKTEIEYSEFAVNGQLIKSGEIFSSPGDCKCSNPPFTTVNSDRFICNNVQIRSVSGSVECNKITKFYAQSEKEIKNETKR